MLIAHEYKEKMLGGPKRRYANEAVSPLVHIEEGALSNAEIRATIDSLTQVFATQVDRYARVQVNPNSSATTSRIRDFTRMNPSTFFSSNVEEDP